MKGQDRIELRGEEAVNALQAFKAKYRPLRQEMRITYVGSDISSLGSDARLTEFRIALGNPHEDLEPDFQVVPIIYRRAQDIRAFPHDAENTKRLRQI